MIGSMARFFKQYQGYVLLAFIVLLFQAGNFSARLDQIRHRALSFDYDGYWHLLRVQEIHRTGSWDNEINPRGNAPFGERIHWTHAMDLVLWAGASVGALCTDFDTSLYWWGVFVGPAFYVFSLAVLAAFGPTLLRSKHALLLPLLFVLNLPQLISVYAANRPDHHCLVAFLYVLYYCLFVALIERPSGWLAIGTALAGAVGLWAGLEMLVLIGLSAVYLGLLWVTRGADYLKANALLALALSLGLLITIVLDEKPRNYWVAAYDRRSIVHVALFFCLGLHWLAIGVLSRVGIGKAAVSRLIAAAATGAVALLACLAIFPGLMHGPLGAVDPRLQKLYLSRTGEFGELYTSQDMHLIVYTALLVLPALAYLLWAWRRNAGGRRVVFVWLAAVLCVYSVMMLTMGRWLYTLAFVSILPTALLIKELWTFDFSQRRPVFAFFATIVLCATPYVALVALAPAEEPAGQQYDSQLMEMLSFIDSQDYAKPGDILLAQICIGPAILYHTSLSAVGTPNHSNVAGIVDTYKIVTAADDEAAKALMEVRGVDLLLIDKKLREFAEIRLESGEEAAAPSLGQTTFISRLTGGRAPAWLVRMPVPEGLSETFTLYCVLRGDVEPAQYRGESQ